jgi:hypothetical protein
MKRFFFCRGKKLQADFLIERAKMAKEEEKKINIKKVLYERKR